MTTLAAGPWNTLEVAKVTADFLTPIAVAVVAYSLNLRLRSYETSQRQRDAEMAEARRRETDEIERRHEPHIEFNVDCNLLGPQRGYFLAEFLLQIKNVSLIRHEFKSILLRVRGIRSDAELEPWEDHGGRLEFPTPLFESEVIPDDLNFIFVEPGVSQTVTFISRVSQDLRFIVARAEFWYDRDTPHHVERVFEVGAALPHVDLDE